MNELKMKIAVKLIEAQKKVAAHDKTEKARIKEQKAVRADLMKAVMNWNRCTRQVCCKMICRASKKPQTINKSYKTDLTKIHNSGAMQNLRNFYAFLFDSQLINREITVNDLKTYCSKEWS